MPAFDLLTAGRALQEGGQQTAAVFQQISALMQVDDATGAVTVDEAQLRAVLAAAIPADAASAFGDNLLQVARGGMLMRETSAVPWVVLEDLAYARQGLPEPIRRDLFRRTPLEWQPAAIRNRLQESFPAVPETIFNGDGSELLLREAYSLPVAVLSPPFAFPRPQTPIMLPRGGPGLPDFDPAEPRPSRPGATAPMSNGAAPMASGIVPPSSEKARGAASCLLNGSWDGLVRGLPFRAGWVLGWSCAISQECATALADLLAGLGGAEALLAAAEALYAGGVAAVVGAVTALPALTVMAIYGLLLSLNIRAANGPNGVTIYGNWPWVVGMYVWALPS